MLTLWLADKVLDAVDGEEELSCKFRSLGSFRCYGTTDLRCRIFHFTCMVPLVKTMKNTRGKASPWGQTAPIETIACWRTKSSKNSHVVHRTLTVYVCHHRVLYFLLVFQKSTISDRQFYRSNKLVLNDRLLKHLS